MISTITTQGTSFISMGIVVAILIIILIVSGLLWSLLPWYVRKICKLLESINTRLQLLEQIAASVDNSKLSELSTKQQLTECPDCKAKHPTPEFKSIGNDQYQCPSCLGILEMDN